MATKKVDVPKLTESMVRKGMSIQRLPPNMVEQTLTYPELSDMLDLVVADIASICPDIFDTVATVYTFPAYMKAYLYTACMYHFKQAGILSNTGGYAIPEAAGFPMPVPLLAWLQFIGTYAEGDVVGKAKYDYPSTIPVVNNQGIAAGTADETTLNVSNLGLVLPGWTTNTTYGEKQGYVPAAAPLNINAFWTSNASSIAQALTASGYPCAAMWKDPPAVPDASYFAYPCEFEENTLGAYNFFVNPFNKWDHEVSMLYFTTASITTSLPGYPIAPRPGPMQREWPTYPSSGSFEDSFMMRKWMFIYIMRHNSYEPGASVASLRQFAGEKLNSFRITPVPIQAGGFWSALSAAVLQICRQTNTYTVDDIFASQVVMCHAAQRRLQKSTIGFHESATNWYRTLLPKAHDTLPVLLPITQIINELGPVVREGMLHVPQGSRVGASSYYWWSGYNTAVTPTSLISTPIVGPSAAAPTWRGSGGTAQTLNATWITNYTAITAYVWVSWIAVQKFTANLIKMTSAGTAYGKGDLTFPVTGNPWGGTSMLVICNLTTLTSIAFENSYSAYMCAVNRILSNVPVVGEEIGMVSLAPWSTFAGQGQYVTKYGYIMGDDGLDPYLERFVAAALTPGGVFLDSLSKAMEKRHGHGDGEYGIVGANENIDACLWDAVKKVAGTIAGAIKPIAPSIAGAGCAQIPLVGFIASDLCESAADALLGYAQDLSKTGTNRHEAKRPGQELGAIAKDVNMAQRAPDGEIPVNRAQKPFPPPRSGFQGALDAMSRKLEEVNKQQRKQAKQAAKFQQVKAKKAAKRQAQGKPPKQKAKAK